MRHRLLLLLALPLLAAAPAAKDDVPCTWTGVERVVAVGDVHGDFDQFVTVLRAAKVIDEKNAWIGGRTHLVQTGDVLDRGAQSRKAMDLLMALEPQAARAGGAVHALIGNHEAMVLLGDWHYVSPGEIEAFGGREAYRTAMSARGKYGKWIRSHNAVIRINDTLFLHAGLRAAYADTPLAEINRQVRAQLQKGARRGPAEDSLGPLWDRFLSLGPEDRVAGELATVLKRFKARRMVVGHTVTREGVETRADGRLIRIDVGMSACYGGPAACLLIEKGVPSEIRAGKPNRRLESPTTRPAASRPAA